MLQKSPSQIGAERILSLPKYETSETVVEAARNWIKHPSGIGWRSICGDKNNRGNVEIVETDVQGLVELITNSSDAYLIQNSTDADSRRELLESVEQKRVLVEFTGDSNGNYDSEYSVIVADEGCGVSRDEFEDAFLRDPSVGGVDKRDYEHLYGEFGQGSLASIGVSKKGCKFVASASVDSPECWSWSLTRYNEERKRYEYLTVNGEVPTFTGEIRVSQLGEINHGTVTKVFNIDSKQTPRNTTKNPFIRRLGHSFPETATPLDIVDNRNGDYKRRTWSGMKNELDDCLGVQKITTRKNIEGFGQISVDAYILKENESFKSEFLRSQQRDRVFYTVYGMTHHTESLSNLRADCGLKGINEDTLLFVDCSNITVPINDIFLPSRTGIREGHKSKAFTEKVHTLIREWSEIQKIDNKRATLADKLDTNGNSPIKNIEFVNKESPVPVYEMEDNDEVEVNITIESDVQNYCEMNHIDIDVVGLNGTYTTEFVGNHIKLRMSVLEDSRVTVCVTDTEFDKSLTGTFSVNSKSEEYEQKVTEIPGVQVNRREDESTVSYELCGPIVSLLGSFLENKNYVVQYPNSTGGNSLKHQTGWQDLEDAVEFLITESSQNVSSSGGSNHPPDYLIENGPAIETKKLNTTQPVQTNSSMPKHKISPENDKLKKDTRNILQSSEKPERDMFYAIGTEGEKELESLWVVQGSTVFNPEGYETKLQEGINSLQGSLKSDNFDITQGSNEPARVKNAGQRGNIRSRFRLMHSFTHPEQIYKDKIQSSIGSSPMFVVMDKERYRNLQKSDKEEIEQSERITKETVVLNESTVSVVLIAE